MSKERRSIRYALFQRWCPFPLEYEPEQAASRCAVPPICEGGLCGWHPRRIPHPGFMAPRRASPCDSKSCSPGHLWIIRGDQWRRLTAGEEMLTAGDSYQLDRPSRPSEAVSAVSFEVGRSSSPSRDRVGAIMPTRTVRAMSYTSSVSGAEQLQPPLPSPFSQRNIFSSPSCSRPTGSTEVCHPCDRPDRGPGPDPGLGRPVGGRKRPGNDRPPLTKTRVVALSVSFSFRAVC